MREGSPFGSAVALAIAFASAASPSLAGTHPDVAPAGLGAAEGEYGATACSQGAAWNGRLQGGIPMEVKGDHHQLHGGRARQRTAWGTPDMVALLKRAARVVGTSVEGPPLVLGSISDQDGGKLGRHKSHQTGRDVDILFYVTDPSGARKRALGFYEFDGQGNCLHKRCRGWTFDVQRNWWLVRTMVWSKRPEVQWIFVSDPLQRLMLAYAARRGEHPEIMRRAKKVMAEPGNSSPHADHFHVRAYCSAADKRRGCRDGGPMWDWIRKPARN